MTLKSSTDQARMAHQVAEILEAEICSGRWLPGMRLPTEAELGRRFGISRAPVREALHLLKAKGLLLSRQGSGNYVANESGASLARSMERYASLSGGEEGFVELLDLRLLMETFCARKMAAGAEPKALADLQDCLDAMSASLDDMERFATADIAFHRAVAAGAAHGLFQAILESLLATLGIQFAKKTYTATQLTRRNLEEHRAILEAIRAGDEIRAGEAMKRHLEASRERLIARFSQCRQPGAGMVAGKPASS